MAVKLVTGTNYFDDFTDGQGVGPTNYFNYAIDEDTNFTSIQTTVNALVDEVRGVQGPNQVLPLDILQLDDAIGIGPETDILIGTASYLPSFISTVRVDIAAGVAILLSQRQASTVTVQLAPRVGTDDGGTDYAYIALDANGAVTINTAPASQVLDIFRVEVNGAGNLFVDNIQRVGTWQYGIDGDNWVELGDSSSLGGTTFTNEIGTPRIRQDRTERLLSGFTTDLQSPAATIGPIVIPGGTEALPGLVLGDGTGTNDLDSGFRRIAADRLGYSAAGTLALEIDAAGQLDLPTNFRVKGRRTAAQTIADGGALTSITFSAADDFDIGTWHAADSDFTVPTDGAGTYLIAAAIEWAEAITNIRDITVEIQLNSTLITGGKSSARLEIGEDHASTVTVVSVLAATDVVRVQVSQDDIVGALGLDVIDATLSIIKVA